MTVSADGNTLYVANADKHVIQAVNLATAVVSTYAGGEGLVGATAGTGTAARWLIHSTKAYAKSIHLKW
jgi:hypothetical protein